MALTNGPAWIIGQTLGPAIEYNAGATQYAVYNGAPTSIRPITITAWFLLDAIPAGEIAIAGLYNAANGADWYSMEIHGNVANDPITAFDRKWLGGHEDERAYSTTGVQVGKAHFAAAVFESADARYASIDGGSIGSNLNNVPAKTVDVTSIGGRRDSTPSAYFTGIIGDVRIYGRAFSATDIYQHYANPWELYAPRVRFWPGFVAAAPTTQLIMTTYAGYSQPVG